MKQFFSRLSVMVLCTLSVSAVAATAAAPLDLCATPEAHPAAGSVNLISAYCDAQKNDPVFQQAKAQYDAAREASPQARSAFLPSLAASANTGLHTVHRTGLSPVDNGRTKNNGYGVTVTQNVLNFPDIFALKKAHASVDAAQKQYEAAQEDLVDRVARAYFNVLQAVDALEFAKENRKALYEQAKAIKSGLDVGVQTEADYTAAYAAYQSARAQYVADSSALQTAREALEAMTETGSSDESAILYKTIRGFGSAYQPQPITGSLESWVQKGLRGNLSLQADDDLVMAAKDAVSAARSGHLPSIAAQGSYGINQATMYGDQPPLGNSRERDVAGSLVLSLPLFQGGLVNSQARQADANFILASQIAQAQYRQVVSNVSSDFYNWQSGISQLSADTAAITASKQALDAFIARRDAGLDTIVSVLVSQSNYFAAQQRHATDLYAFINNQLALEKESGDLNEQDLQGINQSLSEPKNLTTLDLGDEETSPAPAVVGKK